MLRRLLATLAAACASILVSSSAVAALLGTFTFGTLPGSPAAGDLAWITDGGGTTNVGDAAAGGGGNRDLVSWDAGQARWEFVSRIPTSVPPAALEKFLAAVRIDYDNAGSGASATDVQAALDELFAGGVSGSTDLGTNVAAGNVTITSSSGDDAVVPAATGSTAGVLTAMDKAKLDGVASGAIANLVEDTTPQLGGPLDLNGASISAAMGAGTTHSSTPVFNFTNPASMPIGLGVTWGSDQVAKKYPGGPEIDTRNHTFGLYGNKTGLGGTLVVDCEPAWDWSHEGNFRETATTGDDPWPELNYDIFPPKFSMVPTGVTGSFAAGDYIEFSGGGAGKVWSVTGTLGSGGTLTYIHTTSPCAANAQTITNRTGTGSATVGSLSKLSERIRPLQFEWDLADGLVRWFFDVLNASSSRTQESRGIPLAIQSQTLAGWQKNSVTIGASPIVAANTFGVQDHALANNVIANFRFDSTPGGVVLDDLDAKWGGGIFTTMQFETDYGATNTAFNTPVLLWFQTPSAPGAGSTVTRQATIRINNQGGYSTSGGPAILLADQTCLAGGNCTTNPGQYGNILLGGGDYNNGHFSFGDTVPGFDGDADHLWVDQSTSLGRLRFKRNANPATATDGNLLSEMVAPNGTSALGTSAIASGACATVVSASATGVATTDVVSWGFNSDVSGVTGYAPVTTGALSIYAYPSANNVNFKVCNPTSSSITPGAVTLNWHVVR